MEQYAEPTPLTTREALSGISGSISLVAWIVVLVSRMQRGKPISTSCNVG